MNYSHLVVIATIISFSSPVRTMHNTILEENKDIELKEVLFRTNAHELNNDQRTTLLTFKVKSTMLEPTYKEDNKDLEWPNKFIEIARRHPCI